jgi:hypothetical protein
MVVLRVVMLAGTMEVLEAVTVKRVDDATIVVVVVEVVEVLVAVLSISNIVTSETYTKAGVVVIVVKPTEAAKKELQSAVA